MYVLFTLAGVCGIGVGVWLLRSPPERGRPDWRKRRFDQYFLGILYVLISPAFVGLGAAALFFDYDLGVPSQRGTVQILSLGLVVHVIAWSWRRIRRRRRS